VRWDSNKAALRGKFIALKFAFWKRRKMVIHLKILGNGQQNEFFNGRQKKTDRNWLIRKTGKGLLRADCKIW
jgi:hypothetical protein